MRTTLERSQPAARVSAPAVPGTRLRMILLVCGILAALLYVNMNIFVPLLWDGYSLASQVVSELSAVGAPTRTLWVFLGGIFTLLFLAFGWGVYSSAGESRPLRLAGLALLAQGAINLYWPPMHMRGAGTSLTDTLHIVWTAAAALLMLATLAAAAMAAGPRFRRYSIATVATMLVFGVLTGLDAPRVAANLPTPWIGVWERLNIGAYFVWLIVFAVLLLRDQAMAAGAPANRRRPGAGVAGGYRG